MVWINFPAKSKRFISLMFLVEFINNKSFVGYTENGFCLEDHVSLFKTIHNLRENNVKLMMSNADVELVRNAFTEPNYHTDTILCKRTINSTNPDAKAKEVIIKNY